MAEENVQAGAVGEQVGAAEGAGAPSGGAGQPQQQQQQTDPVLARIQELEAEVAKAAELRAQFDAAKSEWGSKEQLHQTEKTLLRAGIDDPEALEVISIFYAKVTPPEGGEKPSLAEWLANRAGLPKAVAAYLPSGSGGAGNEAPPVSPNKTTVPQPPSPDKGTGGNPSPGSSVFSAEAILRMSPGEWAQKRAAALKAISR